MLDLNAMLVFVRVVQAGSFSAASRQLGMPKSTLSRKLAELEERLGARLLQRTTRKLGLTDVGRAYFEQAEAVVGGAQAAEQAVEQMRETPRGVLRVSVAPSLGLLGPIVSAYLLAHPDVQIEILTSERTVDLVEEGFDVAIRAGELPASSLVARRLGSIKRVVVAEPGYCAKHGTPRAPADLAKHACITFLGGAMPDVWALESGGKRVEVRVTRRLGANDFEIMRTAALDGVGIAWMPEHVCIDDIRAGRLRHVLTPWCGRPVPLHAVIPTARQLSTKVARFIDLVRERLHV